MLIIDVRGLRIINCLTTLVWLSAMLCTAPSVLMAQPCERYESPTVVGDRVYLMSQDGVMHIFAAARTYQELGRAELGEAANTCPAFLDGRIYIRGHEHLFCIGGA